MSIASRTATWTCTASPYLHLRPLFAGFKRIGASSREWDAPLADF